MRSILHSLVLLMVILGSGCAHYPVNAPLAQFDAGTGYRFAALPATERNTDGIFVVLALSGGGSRAAAFSYGVLEELQRTRITRGGVERPLLDEVDVITSVSGSSFTAAYYALRHEKTFDEFPQRYLHNDTLGTLLAGAVNPVNWARLTSPTFDRVDLAAETYDRNVFHGATFADLVREHRRPYLVMSASDVTLGARFEFTQEQFDFLYSDLGSMPLARAVAASAAFPVFLSPLTVENHSPGKDFVEPAWVARAMADETTPPRIARRARDLRSYENGAARKHVRLLDGAIADYMGLRGPMEAFVSEDEEFSIRRMIHQGKIQKLVILSVNSVRTPAPDWDRNFFAPNWYDMLWYTASTPIRNNSFDTVAEFKDLLARDQETLAHQRQIALLSPAAVARDALPAYESYFVSINFGGVPDETLRRRLEGIETSLSLKPGEADDLRKGAHEAMQASKEFSRVVQALTGAR